MKKGNRILKENNQVLLNNLAEFALSKFQNGFEE
ncbi:hypothetical protein AJ85_14040 [Alkalihalobacillus alcalophilus ATCC 27647 = CGMCC 1.3604]|uniref:Uncharacterized protein n=1 Tax=Alkalihalobacillus alcalophilus ATCC 27647 = CGMCC 1.3604 TaxID=1218173 RepID=A0A4S4JXT9_ALKAL|nr:hypothetical protein AJ85_14040 [Alkalihalobacillus alcalophilus ATCC 27647 = CGMCC 1.3604]